MKIYVNYIPSEHEVRVTRDIDRYYSSINKMFASLYSKVREG